MKSTVEIIRELSGIVRRIEQDAKGIASRAGGVATVLGRMVELQECRKGEAPARAPESFTGPL